MAGTPRMMIFIPFDPATARALRQAGSSDQPRVGYAATTRLIAAHDYRPDEREDADYAAQLYASIAGLTGSVDGADRRLVVAADVPLVRISDHDSDTDYGAVRIDGLDWSDVAAVFVDEEDARTAVARARKEIAAAADQRLDTVMELPAISALTNNHELLWHTPDEDW